MIKGNIDDPVGGCPQRSKAELVVLVERLDASESVQGVLVTAGEQSGMTSELGQVHMIFEQEGRHPVVLQFDEEQQRLYDLPTEWETADLVFGTCTTILYMIWGATWIELLDAETQAPAAHEPWCVIPTRGNPIEGQLDDAGQARVQGLQSATFEVTFPRYDKRLWAHESAE